jgi:thymidylate kinase
MEITSVRTDIARCIHLAGADGTGKSTQARNLIDRLHMQNASAHYVWLRWPRLLSAPLLVYARLCGYSWQETIDGHAHGYWSFAGSWVMSGVYPWLLWIDALLYSIPNVHLPLLFGKHVICDRFVVDTLADLMTALDDEYFDLRLPGKLFLALLPRATLVVILDLDFAHAVERCPELAGDRTWPQRRRIYRAIAAHQGFLVISSEASVGAITEGILSAA